MGKTKIVQNTKTRQKESYKAQSSKKEKRIRFSDDLLWGIHPVLETLSQNPQRISEIFLQRERHGEKREEIISLAKGAGAKLYFVDSLKITGDGSSEIRHQGVVARISEADLVNFDDFIEKLQKRIATGRPCRIAALDSLQDPHNIGAIIRSALASGVSGILVTRERSAPLGGIAAKSSAGAMAHIDICQVTNLTAALAAIKKIGFWIFGTVKDENAENIYQTDLTGAACIVIGAEGKGIRPLVKKECDHLISIPMAGTLDSLNSSVAAGVVFFEAMRQSLVKSGGN